MSDTDRIDLVTGVRYTGRMIHDNGTVSYFSRTPDGRPIGTVFCWAGKWSSVHDADGKHRSLRALSRRMMLRRASDDLSQVIQQWLTDNVRVTLSSQTVAAEVASMALHSAIMNLNPVTAP